MTRFPIEDAFPLSKVIGVDYANVPDRGVAWCNICMQSFANVTQMVFNHTCESIEDRIVEVLEGLIRVGRACADDYTLENNANWDHYESEAKKLLKELQDGTEEE